MASRPTQRATGSAPNKNVPVRSAPTQGNGQQATSNNRQQQSTGAQRAAQGNAGEKTAAKPGRKYEWPHDAPQDARAAIHAAIELALALLKTKGGREELVGVGLYTTNYRVGDDKAEDEMEAMANFFLSRLNAQFLRMNYSPTQGVPASYSADAAWGAIKPEGFKADNPSTNGSLTISQSVVRSMVSHSKAAKETKEDPLHPHHQNAYNSLLFALGASIAASLVTCFVNFVTRTSPEYQRGYKVRAQSPWGDRWQRFALGGVVVSTQEQPHPLGHTQGGELWVVNEKGNGLLISDSSVKELVKHCFTRLPLKGQFNFPVAKQTKMESIWAGK
ncbi:uncharacterized protein B0H64DRAFT_28013 [Chaetomium fimeti]|uniref:Uncharacterized protein n=1 Tax=Chaetomium fimeti TaxID=1854472 RepID=A0AAE0HQP8_9PEZI|nr:hypothetical protein B0H64DRAFT_28013 [Chaetomium fimeti]